MKQISLEEALGDERDYVAEHIWLYQILHRTDYSVSAYIHDEATKTCFEKLNLLRKEFPEQPVTKDCVVKALYVVVGSEWKPYLFVLPELGYNVKMRKNISGGSRRKNRKLSKVGKLTNEVVQSIFKRVGIKNEVLPEDPYIGEDAIPEDMQYGTCTPFISEKEAKNISYFGELEAIFIHDNKDRTRVVDVSVGGKGELAERTSLHLPYFLIFDILRKKYEEKVHLVDFFNY